MAYKVLDVCRLIINYSNENNYRVSNLKLQKLLYFVQAYFLIKEDKPCFEETIEAWDFGPVVPEAYHEYKRFGSSFIPPIGSYVVTVDNNIWKSYVKTYDDTIIKKADRNLIYAVIKAFANYSASDLVEITHRQSPWKNAYERNFNNEITRKSIKDYFNER